MKTKKEEEGGGLEAENLILENERKKRERERNHFNEINISSSIQTRRSKSRGGAGE